MKGRILDDDTIITTLENLKREAAEVTRKVEETDIVMQEVETVSQQYLPLSTACSSIYFTMESLKQVTVGAPAGDGAPRPAPSRLTASPTRFQIHFLYQYSLQFFLDIYHNVLYENPNLKGITDHTQRLSIITKDLFQVGRPALGCLRGGKMGGHCRGTAALPTLVSRWHLTGWPGACSTRTTSPSPCCWPESN